MPEWRQPAFPLRVVFSRPPGVQGSVVLKLSRTAGMPAARSSFHACTPGGAPVPFRVMHADDDEVVLLVDTASASEAQTFLVYFGGKGPPEGTACPEAGSDPLPVAAGIFRMQSKGIPTSWERMRYMLNPFRTERLRQRIGLFPAINEVEAESGHHGARHERRRAGRIAVMRSLLLVPAEGLYRFAIDCDDAGFVLVDRELVAAWPGPHPDGAWKTGAPVFLKAGVHRIDVYNASDVSEVALRVGWMPPGRTEVMPLAPRDLVGASEAMDSRIERIDQTLQPAFTATPLKAYAFRGQDTVFVPVEFRNNTANWINEGMTCRWRFGDGDHGSGDTIIHTYRAPDLYKATLEVRDALGFVAGCSAPVDCRQMEPETFAVAFDFVGVPAVCFPRDRLAPYLRVKGEVPGSVQLAAEWDWIPRNGTPAKGRSDASPRGQPVLVPLGQGAAGELASLKWRIRHAGSLLAQGTVVFTTPPYKMLPGQVEGDALQSGENTRIVLVGDEAAGNWRQAPLTVSRGVTVVCIDDSLVPEGATDAGSAEPYHGVLARLLKGTAEVRFAPLPAWETAPQSFGPLRVLVDAPDVLQGAGSEVAVLSVGLRDLMAPVAEPDFERKASVLSDLIGRTRKVPVVWVTPPPYPANAERSRQYAVIIRRVAEARGMPVADLYTAFRCYEGTWQALFARNPLELSAAGQRLAAQVVARALVECGQP